MSVHHNRFLGNKTNSCTEFQLYWYYYSTVSDNLSAHHQEFLAYIGFGTFYAVVMNRLPPGVGWNAVKNIILIVAEIKLYLCDITSGFRKKYSIFLIIEDLLTNIIIIIRRTNFETSFVVYNES
jgi:hypothetical protein